MSIALRDAFCRLDTTRRICEALRSGSHRAVGGLWGSSAALFLASLEKSPSRPVLVVTAEDEDSQLLANDLPTFGGTCLILPTQRFDSDGEPEPTTLGKRAKSLSELAGRENFSLLASLESLLQPAPAVDALSKGRIQFSTGERLDQGDVLRMCTEAGMRVVPVVLAPGEVSQRGDVIDILPLTASEAVRFEFFDDELESIRTFDPASQRSLSVVESITLTLGGSTQSEDRASHVLEHVLRSDLLVLWYEPLRIQDKKNTLTNFDSSLQKSLQQTINTLNPLTWLEFASLPSQDLDYKILSAGSAVGSGETDPVGRLRTIRGLQGKVEIVCRTDKERDRLGEIFAHKQLNLQQEQVALTTGALSRGFRVAELATTIISNTEFAGVPASAVVRERPQVPSKAVASFFELGPGDLVVHAAHGIARFECIERIERGESIEEHLKLEFKDDVRLLVPVSKIHLVQKYVGAGEANPRLDKLGGKGFGKRKEEVQKALFDMASDLLEVQAQRDKITREPYPRESIEDEFLDDFPFEDTEDQATVWTEIQSDLEKRNPMDRLLCGDVGFGKTEIAMRTAFRVAATGRQVAILVPTTVLADQHHKNFEQRFEPHGLRVEMLTRYVTGKRRKEILQDNQSGRVDVVIGTQRLLSGDVKFADLGLVIIDEEQRFGVGQKEHLKQLRLAVDVLSLSATPIPRTLHAGLLGIRAISTITTPPAGRQDVDTRVCYRDDAVLRHAIRREISRDGQVFLLHNRIAELEPLAELVKQLVPEAKTVIGHGQMTASKMETALRSFVQGSRNVLVCTTIVENGLDIPRANTILIDRADNFGLAELHQLRGRVGRSAEKAYCFLMMDRSRPPGEEGKKRLKALEEFSNLGAGFAIAMKDLEIRGAGNILGPQQSGHIAAVGYEMYCSLLKTAVQQAKHHQPLRHEIQEVDVDLQIQAFLPDHYAQDPKARLELLREMDDATNPEAALAIRQDLADRFGKLPQPVENLLRVFLLKHLLMQHGVRGIQRTGPDRVVVRHPPGEPLGGAWLDVFADTRPVEAGKTHLILPRPRRGSKKGWTGEQCLQLLLDSLCGGQGWSKMEASWRKRSKSNPPSSRPS